MSKITVVGMGPGDMGDMTPKAQAAIAAADLVLGYSTYIKLIEKYFPEQEFVNSGMTREVERCRLALEKAQEGKKIALISSGDSGIYGMAGIMLEVVNQAGSSIPVEVIPGITAASAAAAILGAPLMHDFAVISLSDLLTPLDLIYKRVEAAAAGDFVICFYNPKSKSRTDYIAKARELVLAYRKPETPVGIVRNGSRAEEEYVVTTLKNMLTFTIDMFTTVLIGNSQTYVENGRMITPRGYALEQLKCRCGF